MEMVELTPIQRILNTLYSNANLSGEHYKAAQQQHENLCGKLKNIEKFYPQKYEAIKSNYERKKKVIPEISKIKDDMKSRCPGLIKALELAVKFKKDEDGSARRELVMLLDTDYLEVKPKKGEDGRKKGGSPPSEQIDPNTIRMTTLWEFLSDEINMSLLDINEQIAEQARGEFQQLRAEWEEILNREDKKVRSFLNSKDYPKKNSLSSMRVDDQNPLHKVMKRLAESKKTLSQKNDIIYEYVTLVNVCTEFRRHAAHKREDVIKKVPAKENPPKGATNGKQTEERHQKSAERTRDEGSEVDQKSYLDTLLQTYCEDMDIDEDEKEKSRQEFLKLKTLRGKYGPPKESVPNVDPPNDGKLENIVTEDQKGVSESLFGVLRYAKKKGLEKWQWAAAEFGQLADVLISMAKEDHLGARPKVPGADYEWKGSALFELLLKWDGADQIMKDKAKNEYVKISDRARKLPTLKAEHQNLGQSVSMLNNPQDIPDDPESTTYNVLQILRATDPEGKKYRGAWNEYFCLLAEEQRFIRIVNQNQVKSGEQGSRLQVFHRQAPPSGDHSGKYVSQVQVPPPEASGEVSSFVQAPCERQPQRIVIQEGEIRMPYSQWRQVKEELDRKTQEVDELSSRLSRFASQQLTSGNPNIADLSDRNRPTKIGEMFGQLYDNEWSEAFDSLKTAFGNATQKATSASLKSVDNPKSRKKSTRDENHSLKVKSMRDVSNVQETVGQDDRLWKSQREASTRGDRDRLEGATSNTVNEAKGDLNKQANSSISSKVKRKNVAESIKSSVGASVSGEEGGEGDGVVSKQDNQSENSKDAAKKEGDDRKQEHCEGAEGGRDDRKKKSVEIEEEEEEEDVNLRELTILQGIVMAAYEFSLEQAALQLSKLETDIADTITLNTSQENSNPSSSMIEADTALRKEFRVFASQEAKDFRKMVGTLSFKMAAKIFAKEKLPYLTENCPVDSAIVEYGNKCVELTWFMVIQDPPMKLVCPKHGEKFKKTEFAYHGRTGKIVELCVWPALYLHEGGPLVNKGHVLPIEP